jgi:hypothetical protein
MLKMEKFHIRFGIEVGEEEARRRFVNRSVNEIFSSFFYELHDRGKIQRLILTRLGENYRTHQSLMDHLKNDFYRHLQAIEALYSSLDPRYGPYYGDRDRLEGIILAILGLSEVDLGIRWKNGHFLPSRAEILDQALVDDPLRWLRLKPEYETVIAPFEKSLRHLVQAKNRPELYQDVIRDAYEALEALGNIVTGRKGKDLSANRDLLIKRLGIGDKHKNLLAAYINFAHEYRHAEEQAGARKAVGLREAESFVYLTGWFIRLAIERPSKESRG